MLFSLQWGVVGPPSNPQAERPSLVGCNCLFNIFAATLYLEALYSFHNLSKHHAMVTRDPLNVETLCYFIKKLDEGNVQKYMSV
jgi:hypothetical protein